MGKNGTGTLPGVESDLIEVRFSALEVELVRQALEAHKKSLSRAMNNEAVPAVKAIRAEQLEECMQVVYKLMGRPS